MNCGKKKLLYLSLAVLAFFTVILLLWLYCCGGFVFRLMLRAVWLGLKVSIFFFRSLFVESLPVIWLPALSYLALSGFTGSVLVKKAVLSLIVLVYMALLSMLVRNFSLMSLMSLSKIKMVFLVSIQLYLFLLFLLPGEMWNFIGGFILFLKSSVVMVFPDIPSFVDDFGIIMAVFSFIFLYLNTVASLVKRAGDSGRIRLPAGVVSDLKRKGIKQFERQRNKNRDASVAGGNSSA